MCRSSAASLRTPAVGLRPAIASEQFGRRCRMRGRTRDTNQFTPSIFGRQSIAPRNTRSCAGLLLGERDWGGAKYSISTPVGTEQTPVAPYTECMAQASTLETAMIFLAAPQTWAS